MRHERSNSLRNITEGGTVAVEKCGLGGVGRMLKPRTYFIDDFADNF
jgi:hypothetical protein